MAPFDRSHTSFYSSFILNMSRYSASNIGVTFKSGLGFVQGH